MICFHVFGVPKGQPRPRAFAFNGKARVFDSGTAEGWKSAIAEAARPHLSGEPFSGPLVLRIDFFFPRPKSHFTKKGLRPTAPHMYVSKPDADNAAKAVMDALTTLRVWNDDAQVTVLIVGKYYAAPPGDPGARITIDTAAEAAEGANHDPRTPVSP